MKILATALQAEEGLFYVSDHEDAVPKFHKNSLEDFKANMAIGRESAPGPYDTGTEEAGELADPKNTNDSGDKSET